MFSCVYKDILIIAPKTGLVVCTEIACAPGNITALSVSPPPLPLECPFEGQVFNMTPKCSEPGPVICTYVLYSEWLNVSVPLVCTILDEMNKICDWICKKVPFHTFNIYVQTKCCNSGLLLVIK